MKISQGHRRGLLLRHDDLDYETNNCQKTVRKANQQIFYKLFYNESDYVVGK